MQSTLIWDAPPQVELHWRLLYFATTSGTCCTTFIRIFQQCIAILGQCKTVCDLRLLSRLSCVAGGKLHLFYLLQIIVLRHHQWHLLHYIYKNISTVHCNTRPVQNRVWLASVVQIVWFKRPNSFTSVSNIPHAWSWWSCWWPLVVMTMMMDEGALTRSPIWSVIGNKRSVLPLLSLHCILRELWNMFSMPVVKPCIVEKY